MIAKILVFACAAFGVVTGSCFEIRVPQQFSPRFISIPAPTESSQCLSDKIISCGPSFSGQIISNNVFSNESPSPAQLCPSRVLPAPVTDNIFSNGSPCSSPGGSEIFTTGSIVPVVPDNSFSDNVFSTSSCGSIPFQVTNGPETCGLPVAQSQPLSLPAVEGPIVTLSSQQMPSPKVLSSRFICTKTIVKPQVYQRTVTVPKIQRYLKRTVTPVVENVAYKSAALRQPEFTSDPSPISFGSDSSDCQTRFVSSSSPVIVSSRSCPRFM